MMWKAFLGFAGAALLAVVCNARALAQDYAVPVIIGGNTYTLTVAVTGTDILVKSVSPELKVGPVQPVKAEPGKAEPGKAEAAKPAAQPPTAADQQAQMASAVTIPYDDLFRNNEQHVGKTVRYVGKVLQFGQVPCILCANADHYLRIGVTPKGYGIYDHPIYVIYAGKQRFLEDDIVTVWGTVDGLESYLAVLGNEITIPRIKAVDVALGDVKQAVTPAEPGKPAANRSGNLRGGPGTSFPVVGSVEAGQALTIKARNQDASWFQLEGDKWIAAFLVDNAPAAGDVPEAPNLPAAPAAAEAQAPAAAAAAPAAAAPAQAQAAAAASPGMLEMNQQTETGGWRIKGNDLHKRKTVYFYDNSFVAMGHFLVVILDATNLQGGTDYFAKNFDPVLVDDAGNTYDMSGRASGYAEWQYGGLTSVYSDVNPGNLARIAMAFDLPDSVGHVVLRLNKEKSINLGDFGAMKSEDN